MTVQGTLPANLVDLFASRVERYRTRTFLRYKEAGTYVPASWLDVAQRVLRTAQALARLGVRAGDRVALLAENRPEWVIADLAILSCGAATVPIYPTSTRDEIHYLLEHSGSLCGFVSTAAQAEKVKGLDHEIRGLKPFIAFEQVSGFERLADLEAASPPVPEPHRVLAELARPVTRESLATVIYTSGTTGRPKGAALTHGNFLANCEAGAGALEIGERDIALSYLPLSHVFERMAGYYFLIQQGAEIAYAESIQTVPQNLLDVRPTMMTSVPRLFEKMYAAILAKVNAAPPLRRKLFFWAAGVGRARAAAVQARRRVPARIVLQYALASQLVFRKVKRSLGGRLRFFISGGAPLPKDLAEFFLSSGVLILEGYGLTETSPVISVNRLDDFRFGTVGKPMAGVQVRIAEDGEIQVKGPNVMKGYFRDDEATRAVFRDGWFCTGDVGEFDSDGYLRITDRKKEIIVTSHGKKVPPQVVEGLLVSDRYISQVYLYGDRRPYVTALVVPNFTELEQYARSQGLALTTRKDLIGAQAIQALIRERITERLAEVADFMKPKAIQLLEREFSLETGELTPTLKLKRSVVAQRYAQEISALYASPA